MPYLITVREGDTKIETTADGKPRLTTLTDVGVGQVCRIGDCLKEKMNSLWRVVILTSPVPRMIHTAEILALRLGISDVFVCEPLNITKRDQCRQAAIAIMEQSRDANVVVAVTHYPATHGLIEEEATYCGYRQFESPRCGIGQGILFDLGTGKAHLLP